ncbi:MAG: YggT family protein [Rhodospirillaceae bacterium]
MQSLFFLIDTVIGLYIWLLIASAILSWLVILNVVNTRNRGVIIVGDFLYRVTEPVLRPIRRVLPSFGGIDISPVALILLLIFLQNLIREYGLYSTHFGGGALFGLLTSGLPVA